MTSRSSPLVQLHVWGVPTRAMPTALWQMATDRRPLRRIHGLRFAKLLGTGSGRTFAPSDSDPRHWALLTVWDSPVAAHYFHADPVLRRWDEIAEEHLAVTMSPISARGRWSGLEPFDTPEVPPEQPDPRVAVLTRARLRPSRALRFWRAVPPVAADLHLQPGVRLALAVGEAPVGLQGTFSIWDSAAAITEFAYGSGPHVDVVRRTPTEQWYTEEFFARLAVLQTTGTCGGVAP